MAFFYSAVFSLTVIIIPVVNADVINVLSYTVAENASPHTFIADIADDSGLTEEYPPEVAGNLYLVFVDESSSPQIYDLFSLQNQSVLTTADSIDRDQICESDKTCQLQLNLQVQPARYFHIIKVNILITDINDNAPVFSPNTVVKDISESSLSGKTLPLPQATDTDSPQFGVVSYKLREPSSLFELRVTRLAGEIVDVQLVLVGVLDRETTEEYRLDVVATDSGNNTGVLHVKVRVQDVNDNPPVFDNVSYNFTVPENAEIGTFVGKVFAEDSDSGANGIVHYDLSQDNPEEISQIFSINQIEGQIEVKGVIDFETSSSYTFIISAHNNDPTSMFSLAKVTVNVVDVNDNAPVIRVRRADAQGAVSVEEATGEDAFVAHLVVSDDDSGQNGLFNCTTNSDDFKLSRLFDTDFKLTSVNDLDRETQISYQVRILCADFGTPVKWSEKIVVVRVTDINDNYPQFSKPEFTRSIPENNVPGSFLLQIRASDPDAAVNGTVRYKLANDSFSDLVHLDAISGNITSQIQFDREHTPGPLLEFVVVASDLGDPTRETRCQVIIEVIDVDDEDPTFLKSSYTFGVYENEMNITEVGHVEAVDRDSYLFNQFTYSISAEDDDAAFFTIDQHSGRIYTSAVLDREQQASYHITVEAASAGTHVISSTANVSIYVADKNDNSPVFTFPSLTNNSIHISSRTPRTELIGILQAQDPDNDLNARLSYQIVSGNEERFFTLDQYSGAIILEKAVGHFSHRIFSLVISVNDGGESPRKSEGFLNIVVDKKLPAKSAPILSNPNLTIVIAIATTSGVLVVILLVAIASILKWPALVGFFNYRKRKYAYKAKIINQLSEPVSEPQIVTRSNDVKDDMTLNQFSCAGRGGITNLSYEAETQCCSQMKPMNQETCDSQVNFLQARQNSSSTSDHDLESLTSNVTDSGRGSHGSNEELPSVERRESSAPAIPPRQRVCHAQGSRCNGFYNSPPGSNSPHRPQIHPSSQTVCSARSSSSPWDSDKLISSRRSSKETEPPLVQPRSYKEISNCVRV